MIVIDTDLGLRNLDVVMGLENKIVYNLVDVIEGNCRVKQALIRDKRFAELYLLPSAQTRDKSSVSPEQMQKLVSELKSEFDYILLDCPAGIEQGFQNAIAGADRAVIVTTPEVSAIRDADRIIGLLETRGIKKNALIINRLRIDMVRKRTRKKKKNLSPGLMWERAVLRQRPKRLLRKSLQQKSPQPQNRRIKKRKNQGRRLTVRCPFPGRCRSMTLWHRR